MVGFLYGNFFSPLFLPTSGDLMAPNLTFPSKAREHPPRPYGRKNMKFTPKAFSDSWDGDKTQERTTFETKGFLLLLEWLLETPGVDVFFVNAKWWLYLASPTWRTSPPHLNKGEHPCTNCIFYVLWRLFGHLLCNVGTCVCAISTARLCARKLKQISSLQGLTPGKNLANIYIRNNDWQGVQWWVGTLPKTNSSPLNICFFKRKVVFQPSIFRCNSLVSRRVSAKHWDCFILQWTGSEKTLW